MGPGIYAVSEAGQAFSEDRELELVDRLAAAVTEAGFRADRVNVANFYAALKHRPMAILVGPAGGGKAALVKCFADILAGNSGLQRQIAPGHAWYAGGRPASTVLVEMHARMLTEKVLFLMEEALQPENAHRVFVAAMTHISPAELLSFFTEVACQVPSGQLMRIGDTHLSAPVPFPSNLLLIGTMDSTDFDWWDEDLLYGATVIEWRADALAPRPSRTGQPQSLGGEFLKSRLRNTRTAYRKLLANVLGLSEPLRTIMEVRTILQAHKLEFPSALLDEVIVFLGNAWSMQGNGLFDPSASRNLTVASDLALAQLVLPHNLKSIRSSEALQAELHAILDQPMPRSGAMLRRQCQLDVI